MTIIHGDCIEVMATMDAGSVDAIVTDPPYGLVAPRAYHSFRSTTENGRTDDGKARRRGGFMGKKWDGTGIEQDPATWEACLRVLKPGGYLLSFGGTRTFHRIAVAIEDAGFQIQDTLSWLHGQGFPKGKAQLKPAWEPIIMARKPGRAVLQIDACRVSTTDDLSLHGRRATDNGWDARWSQSQERKQTPGQVLGRWPANVCLDEEASAQLDAMSGERASSQVLQAGRKTYANGDNGWSGGWAMQKSTGYGDTGGASRFFYCAKSSRTERSAGLDSPSTHPTVKPLSLMRWLVRLVTPPGGTVLDPFTGSGTTGCAAVLEGFDFIGIEQDSEYAEIARKRIAYWTPETA